jgi:hypothetical protein
MLLSALCIANGFVFSPLPYVLRKTLHPSLGYRFQQFTFIAIVIHESQT